MGICLIRKDQLCIPFTGTGPEAIMQCNSCLQYYYYKYIIRLSKKKKSHLYLTDIGKPKRKWFKKMAQVEKTKIRSISTTERGERMRQVTWLISTLHFRWILKLRVPVSSVKSTAKSMGCASLISAEGRGAGWRIVSWSWWGLRCLLCMCLYSSVMLLTAAQHKPRGWLSHKTTTVKHNAQQLRLPWLPALLGCKIWLLLWHNDLLNCCICTLYHKI